MITEPLLGPSTGVVVTTKFPSTSESPASVKSPEPVPLNEMTTSSLSTTGPSLIGLTVIKIVSFTQIAGSGVPSSQI